ncbi:MULTISPECIES: iron-containing alcohol dehydrogenase [Paraburkholderia]|uniref:iron-containing alcohol dehydrogenase n=1 Tax=Paraburkholderia TaxID=1822464 RepID=UPI002254F041|nr:MULTISPECIES: iron-containing alcohol dehydrogenase [Paraburkholderia]MCX4161717.1 iron-containing alcohol dehydrogenase [Paraburkholderia megapolitana]MDN7157214.1 iron-containing alcohol dehydrogenase [Paraburkholderia sp. CHISQ3]MDQ6494259.1 iron-containing alcohol dehydrogenase [Paraburkholderia megapolitana]
MSLPSANWNYPTAVKVGAGRVRELSQWCKSLGMRKPLLITDPGLASLPLINDVLQQCRADGLESGLFHQIKGNPTGKNVEDGVAAYKAGGHDGVIAFGGGSALDAAKAVALMVGQDRPLWDFEDIGDNYLRVNVAGMAPVVAVPTTAGTGSEVGRASVITDDSAHVKRIIFHARMLPAIVILDPELTVGLPAKLTAATGMDALSHNLEAYCSPFYHPMAAGIAVEGIRLIKQFLPRAVRDGHDLDARLQMLVASSMGATAFQRGLGGMHALAHPLGALYDAHHGLLNAILMPYVLKANESVIAERIELLARYLELASPSFGTFLDWVLSMRDTLEIPHTLQEIGIDAGQAAKVGAMAVADGSSGTNPIQFTADEYSEIFVAAVNGSL